MLWLGTGERLREREGGRDRESARRGREGGREGERERGRKHAPKAKPLWTKTWRFSSIPTACHAPSPSAQTRRTYLNVRLGGRWVGGREAKRAEDKTTHTGDAHTPDEQHAV